MENIKNVRPFKAHILIQLIPREEKRGEITLVKLSKDDVKSIREGIVLKTGPDVREVKI